MSDDAIDCPLSRRSVLAGSGALFAWSFMPFVASAAGSRDARFLTIVLRGGLDGLVRSAADRRSGLRAPAPRPRGRRRPDRTRSSPSMRCSRCIRA